MDIEIRVPQAGESISEATLVGWHFEAGQEVRSGETLADLETDKVTLELPAPEDGLLTEIRCQVGETVKVGQVLAVMKRGGAKATESTEGAESPENQPIPNETLPPGAARLAYEEGIDPKQVRGSGIRGQVTKPDLINFLEQQGQSKSEEGQGAVQKRPQKREIPPAAAGAALQRLEQTEQAERTERTEQETQQGAERETIVPLSSLRRRIAERLLQAQQTAAILTTFNEIDMRNAIELRRRYKELFQERHGVGLGYMSIFSKAVIHAIQAVPIVNAEIRDQNIIYKNYCNLGIAVGGPRGLVVPVLRDAERKSFAEIEREIVRLADKVKQGTVALEDLQGGSFTISNGGIYGSMLSTPILNPPQSGILGMHAIVERPVARGGEIAIRPIMYVAFSYDHRIIDGKDAVTFLVKVKEAVEDPERMLLSI